MNHTTDIVEQAEINTLLSKSIVGCNSVLLDKIQEIAEIITAEADLEADIIIGMNFEDMINDNIKIVLLLH